MIVSHFSGRLYTVRFSVGTDEKYVNQTLIALSWDISCIVDESQNA